MTDVHSYTRMPMWVWSLIMVALIFLAILYIKPDARHSLAQLLFDGEPIILHQFGHEGYRKGGPSIVRPPLY